MATRSFSLIKGAFALAFGVCLLWPLISQAKRVPPPKVPSIDVGPMNFDVRFTRYNCLSKPGFCGFQVFLIAKESQPGGKKAKEVWKTLLFERTFKPKLETDVQEVYPVEMKLEKSLVQVKDEKDQLYQVDPKSGTLVSPKNPIEYKD